MEVFNHLRVQEVLLSSDRKFIIPKIYVQIYAVYVAHSNETHLESVLGEGVEAIKSSFSGSRIPLRQAYH